MLKFYSRQDLSVVFSSWDLLAPELHRKMLNFTDRSQLQLGSICEVKILLLRPNLSVKILSGPTFLRTPFARLRTLLSAAAGQAKIYFSFKEEAFANCVNR